VLLHAPVVCAAWGAGLCCGLSGCVQYVQLTVLLTVQYVRTPHCDGAANEVYWSAGELFAQRSDAAALTAAGLRAPTAPSWQGAQAAWRQAPGGLADSWPHTTLQASCTLFARKFTPDTSEHLRDFFESCSQLGLSSECLAARRSAPGTLDA
jgi:hypothetical protein